MPLFRIIYKLIGLVFLALISIPIVMFLTFGSHGIEPNEKLKAYRKKWLQQVVKVVGIKIEIRGETVNAAGETQKHALWTANHISWMDIAVIGSQGSGFLSKAEVRKWPIIGWLGEKGGTVFIERGGKNASQIAAKAIAKHIQNGDNILVFPEGTTHSGEDVKRFHARIFAPALDHQLMVQPIALKYLDKDGQRHPKAAWNNQSFIGNLMGVLAQPSIHVVLTFLPMLDSRQFSERKKLAETIEQQIRDVVLAS